MPEHQISTSKTRGKIRTSVTIRRGEVISLCRCWHSKKFPLCDSSHKDLDDVKGPIMINTDCDQNFIKKEND